MLQIGGELDFLKEPLGAENGAEFRAEHFERDETVVPEVLGQVDRGHASRAQLPIQPITVGERYREAFQDSVHGSPPDSEDASGPEGRFPVPNWR